MAEPVTIDTSDALKTLLAETEGNWDRDHKIPDDVSHEEEPVSGGYAGDEENEDDIDYGGGSKFRIYEQKTPEWKIQPDKKKCAVASVMFLVISVVFIIFSVAMMKGGLFCPPTLNQNTLSKLGLMYSYQNHTASPCVDYYNYVCGSYDARFQNVSTYSETQNQIVSVLTDNGNFDVSINRDLPVNYNFNETGLFECVFINVWPDYQSVTTYAVYISPICVDCPPQIHHLLPGEITEPVNVFPDDINELVTLALSESKHVYWITPESGATPHDWYTTECDKNATSAEAQWASISTESTKQLLITRYDESLDDKFTNNSIPNTDENDLINLVNEIKTLTIEYIGIASWIKTDATRTYLQNRVLELPIYIGKATVRNSGCTTTQTLYDCVRYSYSNEVHSLTATVNPNSTYVWPFSQFVVNAAYDPTVGAIYIPWGIAQLPFYDPLWLESVNPLLRISTLGWVIAHEIGHAIDNTYWNQIPYTQKDTDALEAVKSCISTRYTMAGSLRSDRTESENWADYVGFQTVFRKIRLYPQHQVMTALVALGQIDCNAGGTAVNAINSTDPHSSPRLRGTAAVQMFRAWYSATDCPYDQTSNGLLCD